MDDVVEFLDTMRKPLEGAKRIAGPYPYYGASGIVDYVDGYLFNEELILLSEDGANITDRNYPICFLASGKYWVNNHAHVLRTKKGNENNFICNSLERKDYTQYNTGMAMPKLNKETCKKIPLVCPTFEEQKKIGDYFRNLDNLITLHHRKLNSSSKRETFAWEQRKVTDLSEIYIGLVTTMTEHYTDKGHLLIRNSDIKDGYFEFGENPIYLDEEFSEQNKSRMHQLGDVITVHTGDIGTSAVIGENEVNSIGFATIITRPNQEVLDSNYFATYLNTHIHKQWAISMATGDGRSNYNLKDYTKLEVPIPQIEEQKKIAACVGNLNHLITLHHRKYEELQKIKKFMLQNMFV